jgi:hypothetical protein
LSFPRSLMDDEVNVRGKQLILFLNSLNLVVLNGLDSGGGYTFDQKSTVDYIIVSENIFAPSFGSNLIAYNFDRQKLSGKLVHNEIPTDSFYKLESCKVWSDNIYTIGDHLLLSCQLLDSNISKSEVKFQSIGQPLDVIKWNRNDHGNLGYWNRMQVNLQTTLSSWWEQMDGKSIDISKIILEFNNAINDALENSLKKKTV